MKRLVLTLCCVLACGDDASSPDGGERDAGRDGGGDALVDAPADVPADDVGPEPCAEEGAMRTGVCGNCGSGQEICEGGVWVASGPCLGEGECSAGTLDVEALPMCAERTRICSNECAWLDWEETAPARECEPGSEQLSPEGCELNHFQNRACNDSCDWVDSGLCERGCVGDDPRTTPPESEEICIPAGPFIRGHESREDTQPVLEVMMSAFWIDRYPVTNLRYYECLLDDVCTPPVNPGTGLGISANRGLPVQGINRAQANQFCEWDGRRLPTEAEWEKAARGPAPLTNIRPWGNELPRCDIAATEECPGWDTDFPPGLRNPYDYDELPGTASVYGVERMLFGGFQIVEDTYEADFYGTDPEPVDPLNRFVGNGAVRGHPIRLRSDTPGFDFDRTIISRRFNTTYDERVTTIRCARDLAE